MPRIVSRSPDESQSGLYLLAAVLGGMAAGYLLATRAGGIPGLRRRWRDLFADPDARPEPAHGTHEDDDAWDDDADTPFAELEDRVLEAFSHDPVLAHRAVDISATAPDAIALTGWVRREAEAEHAMTIARGVPGVERVSSSVRVKAKR
jgi:hypothetical protein